MDGGGGPGLCHVFMIELLEYDWFLHFFISKHLLTLPRRRIEASGSTSNTITSETHHGLLFREAHSRCAKFWSCERFNGHAGNVGEFVHVLHPDRDILECHISIILDATNAVMGTQEMIIVFSVTIYIADRIRRRDLRSVVNGTVLAHTIVVRITYCSLCSFGLWKENKRPEGSGHLVPIQHECKSDEMYRVHTTGATTTKNPMTKTLKATMITTSK